MWKKSVFVGPGWSAAAEIPVSRSSYRRLCAKDNPNVFEAAYTASQGVTISPAMDAVKRILPSLRTTFFASCINTSNINCSAQRKHFIPEMLHAFSCSEIGLHFRHRNSPRAYLFPSRL